MLRLPPQSKPHATSMQPLQCVLQRHVANPHLSTHMATERDNNHAAIPLRSATTDSKTPYNYAHTNASKAASTHRYSMATKKHQNERPTPASHKSCPPSPAAATLHGKTQGVVLRFPPQHNPHVTSMQPLQCVLQHHVANSHVSTTHMATDHGNNLQPFYCDLQQAIQQAHGTTHA